jgi:hypothetical protein
MEKFLVPVPVPAPVPDIFSTTNFFEPNLTFSMSEATLFPRNLAL